MKHFTIILLSLLSLNLLAQSTTSGTIIHDGLTREYMIYVPASYSAGTNVPLLLNLHGYGSNNIQQNIYANFKPIADTANFIMVLPQGTLDPVNNNAYWNSGYGGTVDDIGFINALLDSVSDTYSIDQNRIYSTGMSNGGFMSLTLAGQLSDRIAAVASVTGVMSVLQIPNNDVIRPVPIMQIHGTNDGTVNYNGDANFLSVDSVLNYWIDHNSCNTTPTITAVPNIDTTDGCTAELYEYTGGYLGTDVVHYKILGGEHTWPGAAFSIGVTNQDFDACAEIWRFFARYEKSSLISVFEKSANNDWYQLTSQNPTKDVISITINNNKKTAYTIYDLAGKQVASANDLQNNITINLLDIPSGIFIIQLINGSDQATLKVIKE